MLKMLLPRIDPNAKFTFFNFSAIKTATASGKEVVAAIKKLPTKLDPSPVTTAIWSPVIDNAVPAAIITIAAIPNPIIACRSVIGFCNSARA